MSLFVMVQGQEHVVGNLKQKTRGKDLLVLWLDCDREGEAIGFEVHCVHFFANLQQTASSAMYSPWRQASALAIQGHPSLQGCAAMRAGACQAAYVGMSSLLLAVLESCKVQVMEVCKSVKQSIAVKRAKFSALVPHEIKHSINNLRAPNKREADAVEARSILDLRSGAAFTRYQTLLLQNAFDFNQAGVHQIDKHGAEREKLLISFGSCQYPLLGLIVKRHWCAVVFCCILRHLCSWCHLQVWMPLFVSCKCPSGCRL